MIKDSIVNKKQIFIHSLFRTGSTYLWNKFRQYDHFYCYYEPFHPSLNEVTLYNIESILTKDYQAVHHPSLSRYYLYEYRQILTPEHRGLPYFKKSFSFDEFCNNNENPDALKYINHLIKNAGEKIPVFQFNRSAGRIRWFSGTFPESLNLYLVRNPRDQWQSYWELLQRTNLETFFTMDLLTASLNASASFFEPLARALPLVTFSIDKYEKEENFYRVALRCYTDEEKYLIFYYTWFWTLMENVLHADLVLNINRLSGDSKYRAGVLHHLARYKLTPLNFEDSVITEYSDYHLPIHKMRQIEKRARHLAMSLYNEEDIDRFFSLFSPEDCQYFEFSRENFLELQSQKAKLASHQALLDRSNHILTTMAEEWLQLKTKFGNLHLILKEKEDLVKQKEGEIAHKTDYIRRLQDQLKDQEMELETKWGQWNQHFQTLSTENQDLIKTNLLLLEKNSELLKKETELHQRYEESRSIGSQLSQQLEELARQNQNLMNKNHQLIDKHQEFEQILSSQSFRSWRSTTLAFKKIKHFLRKKYRNNNKLTKK